MRIYALEIESFRGFRQKCRFNFEQTQLLILYGPNGHGKTSFFDAIEWVLTGEICRYNNPSDEKNKTRFVGNRLSSQSPRVQIEIKSSNGDNLLVIRTGIVAANNRSDYGKSSLVVVLNGSRTEGEAAEEALRKCVIFEAWLNKVNLNRGLNLSHFLGQERINFVLRGMKDSERYDSMSLIFGTEHFYKFKESFSEVKKYLESDIKDNELLIDQQRKQRENFQEQVDNIQEKSPKKNEESKESIQEVLRSLILKLGIDTTEKLDLQGYISVLETKREEIQKQRHDFTNYESKYKVITGIIPEWKKAHQAIVETTIELNSSKELLNIEEKLRNVLWLKEQYPEFKSSEEQISKIEMQLQELKNNVSIKESVINEVHKLLQSLNELISQLRPEDNIQKTLKLLISSEFIDKVVVEKIKTELLCLLEDTRSLSMNSEKYELVLNSHQSWEEIFTNIQTKDLSHKEFLKNVRTFIQEDNRTGF